MLETGVFYFYVEINEQNAIKSSLRIIKISSQINFVFRNMKQSNQIGLRLSLYVELHRERENLISQKFVGTRHCQLNTMYTCLSRSSRLHLYVCILGGLVPSKYAGDIELLTGKRKEKLTVSIEAEVGFSFPFPFRDSNAEHVRFHFCVYMQQYTLSRYILPAIRSGIRLGPDGQTRLGRVNQRAGDLNQ